MSPGRAWSALTTCRLSCLASACRTHVCTAAHPLPDILWPECCSDHVTKLAHHGLPGPTPAAARYWSTWRPVLTPASCTPSWVCATFSAAAPRLLEPEPGAAAAAASTMPGTLAGSATAPGGPTGGCVAMNAPDLLPALAACACAAMNRPESPGFGATAADAAGAAAAASAGAAAGAAAGELAGAAGAGAAGPAVLAATSAGGDQLGSISCLKPRCR